MATPLIIKNDPWLAPFEPVIKKRLDYTYQKEQELLENFDSLADFANGHKFFGIHKTKTEWVLREWAPSATAIYLIGTFSDWKENQDFRFSMVDNHWELRLPLKTLKHEMLYKLMIHWDGGKGERIPAWSRRVVQDDETKLFSAQIWNPAKQYKWKKENYVRSSEPPRIYEAHVGMATEENKVGTYTEFKNDVLPRIKKAGYNTVQLMAIQEHPYYGSFGYHVSSFFGVSSRFGTPEELKEMIDEAHKLGIAVIMDIVHSHSVKNETEGLAKYDGTDYQFFHGGGKGEHPLWDSKCFDYGKNEVVHFLLSNCKYWIEEYQFDGFRFDGVTSMIYWHHGNGVGFDNYDKYYDGSQDIDAIAYLSLANKLIHEMKPSAITIAEEVSGIPGLATPLDKGGLGFDFRLSMGVPDFWIKLLKEMRDEQWHVGNIYHELTQSREDEQTISYAESHDQALVGDKTIAFRLMDKEMYFCMHVGYRSLIIDRGIALHKMIRFITSTTGKNGYLNFMGNEFGHPEWIDFPREGNNWSYHYARRQWSLADNTELRYKFLGDFDADMMELIKNEPHFYWSKPNYVMENIRDQVLVYERCNIYFIFNFNPSESFTDYSIPIQPGTYKTVLNTDSQKYGGLLRLDDNMEYFSYPTQESYYSPHEMKLYIPSRCAFALKKVSD